MRAAGCVRGAKACKFGPRKVSCWFSAWAVGIIPKPLPPHDMQSIRTILEGHGLRCTRQREQIFEALVGSKVHPTAEELFSSVKACEPGLSLATVYNTLEAFTACGLARRLPCPAGPCRYDADTTEHVHITTPDGKVVDLPHDLSRRLLEQRTGMKINALQVQVHAAGSAGPTCNG